MSDEIPESAPLGPGMTRDCRDPWSYVEIHINGDVRPCCVREPIGNLADGTLSQILSGQPIRKLRAMLLSGQLDRQCIECRQRAPIEIDAFQKRIRGLRAEVTLPKDFDGKEYIKANPDVAKAGTTPVSHFLNFGYLEGRALRANSGR